MRTYKLSLRPCYIVWIKSWRGKLPETARWKTENDSSQEFRPMIARKETTTITMKQDREEHFEERIGQKQKPDTGQFRLQVDRQTKRSYATYDAAVQDGTAIKSSYPLLQVAVYDRLASAETIIELPKSINE